MRKVPAINPARYLCNGPFTLDLFTHQARLNDKKLVLPPCLFEYLATLIRNCPHPVSYQDLVLQSQGFRLGRLEAQDLARTRIYFLRKSLETETQTPQYIMAVAGFGYRLVL